MRSLPRKRLQHDTSIVGDASARYSVHSVSAAPITQADHCLSEALRLAERGYALTPVTLTRLPSGKKGSEFHARVRIGGKTLGWRHEAAWSSDPDQIRAWWVDHPDTSFAIGGAANAIEGVDLDVKAHADGVSWWSAQGLPLAPLVQHTPSGGVHLIWRVGEGQGLPQRVDGLTGVDTRNRSGLFYAAGAYILGEEGHYTIAGELPHLEALDVTPDGVVGLFADLGKRERPADGRIVEHDLEWQQAQVKKALESVRSFDRELDTEYRKRLQHLGLMYGRVVEQGITDAETAERQWRKAHCAVWGAQVWPENVKDFRDALRDGPALERWRTPEAAEEEAVTQDSDGSSSWQPVDLDALWDTIGEPREADMMRRSDGIGMFYLGKTHSVHGESESGKSWIGQSAALERLAVGDSVLYVDYEDDATSVLARMKFLGMDRSSIPNFVYVSPDGPQDHHFAELLTRSYELAVIDGVTVAMGYAAKKSNDQDEYTQWYKSLPLRIARSTGAAVVQIDHVSKATGERGRFAIGSQAKMGNVSGSAFYVDVIEGFGQGRTGELRIYVGKDRPGGVRAHAGKMKKDRLQPFARYVHDATDPTAIKVSIEPWLEEGADPVADDLFGPEAGADWRDEIDNTALPECVMAYTGRGRNVIRPLARFMRGYAVGGDGMSRMNARKAMASLQRDGKSMADSTSVDRAWGALREMGLILPAGSNPAGNHAGQHWWNVSAAQSSES